MGSESGVLISEMSFEIVPYSVNEKKIGNFHNLKFHNY